MNAAYHSWALLEEVGPRIFAHKIETHPPLTSSIPQKINVLLVHCAARELEQCQAREFKEALHHSLRADSIAPDQVQAAKARRVSEERHHTAVGQVGAILKAEHFQQRQSLEKFAQRMVGDEVALVAKAENHEMRAAADKLQSSTREIARDQVQRFHVGSNQTA